MSALDITLSPEEKTELKRRCALPPFLSEQAGEHGLFYWLPKAKPETTLRA